LIELLPAVASDGDEWRRVVRRWAARDLEAALAWALEISPTEPRAEALEAVCFGLAESDPASAVALAATVSLHERPGAILENLIQRWAGADSVAALAWANAQPAGELRDHLVARIAFVRAAKAPAEAARLIVENIPSGAIQAEATMTVIHLWARRDFAATAGWVERFPSGALRERAFDELMGILDEHEASGRTM
jgi:hypothetical protein